MSEAAWAYGTQMQMGDGGSPEAFTTIAEVMDIAAPPLTRDQIDVTNHDSPGGYEEIIPTIKRSGNVTFPVNWIPTDATHNHLTGLQYHYDAGDLVHWKLIYTDDANSVETFSGYVMGLQVNAPVAGALRNSITIKPVGVVLRP